VLSPKSYFLCLKFSSYLLLVLLSLGGLFSSPIKAQDFPSGVVSEIAISGNRLVNQSAIREQIFTSPGMQLDKERVVADLKRIYSLGFFEADSVEAKPYRKPDGSILVEYTVKENAPITDIVIYGNNAVDEIDAYDFFNDLIAKPENAKLISDRIKLLETVYYSKGYIVSRITDIDLDESGLLKIYLDEGIIDKIVFKGNEKTKQTYLNHLVSNVELNEPYNESQFLQDYKRLQRVGHFTSVTRSVKPSPDSDGYTLEILLNEKVKHTTLGMGGGINSSAGLFGSANYSRTNIKGQGETLNVNALLGSGFGAGQSLSNNQTLVRTSNLSQISANYNIPYYRNSPYNLSRGISYLKGPNFNVDLSTQSLVGINARTGRSFEGGHRFTLGVNANHIDITDKDRATYLDELTKNIVRIDDLSPADVLKQKGADFLAGREGIARAEAIAYRDEQIVKGFYFGIDPGYSFSNLDDPQNPRDGWKSRFNLNPVLGLSEINSFTKLEASTTRFFPIGEHSSFLFNFRGGAGLAGDIPQFTKFRLGSNTGVRGYRQFSELGIGTKVLIGTAEYRTPIYNVLPPVKKYKYIRDNVQFALFADAGLIGGDKRLNDITRRLSQAGSVGFGLRIKIPLIGALRADIGFPLIQALTKKTKMFRFNFGPANFF